MAASLWGSDCDRGGILVANDRVISKESIFCFHNHFFHLYPRGTRGSKFFLQDVHTKCLELTAHYKQDLDSKSESKFAPYLDDGNVQKYPQL